MTDATPFDTERSALPFSLLPMNPPQYGPVTRSLLARTYGLLAVINLLGLALILQGDDGQVAAGLSLLLPGSGFLYLGAPGLFILTIILSALAMVLWWGLSAFFTVPLVWLGSALVCWYLPNETTWAWAPTPIMAVTAAIYASLFFRARKHHRDKVAEIPRINDYLRTAELPHKVETEIEPGELEREVLGWAYELALQPPDQFEGFDWGEQYHGGTCLRYQLAFLGESLAAYAANALPNYQGEIEPAMASLIERMTDQRVWKYWQVENFLARGSTDPDPISTDNVMLTGFYQSQISLYEAATGSRRFDEPGALKFIWKDGRVFEYNHESISQAIVANLKRSKLGLYSCEPTWVFTICNSQAAQGLIGFDQIHGTDYWQQVKPRFMQGLTEEMMTADGGFRHIRTNVFGFSFNDGDGTGEYFTSGSHGWEDIAPELAARGQTLALQGVAEKMAAMEAQIQDGELNLSLPETKERATYIETAVPAWTGIIGGARAVGNEAVAEAATNRMWRECATGERFPGRPLRAGVQSIAVALWPLWSRPLSKGALNLRGYVPPTGPRLISAPWPAIIVTKAKSMDGNSLDLVLEPYREANNPACRLEFTHLVPNTSYAIEGMEDLASLTADPSGAASIECAVNHRLHLKLVPRDA